MAKNKEKQENKETENSVTTNHESQTSSEKEVSHSEVEDTTNHETHRERTVDFEELSSDVTIGELQEEARMIEDENEAVESPLDRYIRNHREAVEKAKSQLGQDQESEEAEESEKSTSVENSESQEKTESAKVQEIQEVQVEPEVGDFEAQSESEIENKAEDSSGDGKEAAPAIEVIASEQTEALKDEEDEANVEVLEGEVLDERRSRVIFPVPMAVGQEKDSSEKVNSQEDSLGPSSFDDVELAPATEAVASAPFQAEGDSLPNPEKAEFSEDSSKKSYKIPVIITLAAVIVLGGGGIIYMNQQTAHKDKAVVSVSSKEKKAASNFDKAYNAFFTDDKHTALKNSQFVQLPDLKAKLSALSGNKKIYKTDMDYYNRLSDDISAINSINGIFDKAVIVDGKLDKSVVIKDKAKIPLVSSKNSVLNSLLQQAMSLAKSQQESQTKTAEEKTTQTPASSESQAPSTESSSSGSAAASSQTADGPVADSTTSGTQDSSYTWAAGILSQFISTVQSRGIIKGSNYSLVPAGIHTTNGNIYGHNGVILGHTAPIVAGYYNLYNSEGQYLVTVNCKTGYFWGTTNPKDY